MQTAIWIPGWHRLDQTLVLGQREKYHFFKIPPVEIFCAGDQLADLFFCNQVRDAANVETRYAKVIEMTHPQLGPLLKIDADGLDYIFFPRDSEEVVVNAEEEPGTSCQSCLPIDDWTISIHLTDVSEPIETN